MKNNLKIKVCGMREPDNIAGLLALQPDYIGFIFYPESKRYMNQKLPDIDFGETLKTGVFVNEKLENVIKTAQKFDLDVLQLHGNETPAYCQILKEQSYQLIKVFSIDTNFDFEQCKAYEKVADLFLFDTKGKLPGGNGQVFNWDILSDYDLKTPFLLSGGIGLQHTPAIKKLKHPKLAGIDVNSGFEIRPGYKNIDKLKTFFHEIRS